jgi:hypothetical protein
VVVVGIDDFSLAGIEEEPIAEGVIAESHVVQHVLPGDPAERRQQSREDRRDDIRPAHRRQAPVKQPHDVEPGGGVDGQGDRQVPGRHEIVGRQQDQVREVRNDQRRGRFGPNQIAHPWRLVRWRPVFGGCHRRLIPFGSKRTAIVESPAADRNEEATYGPPRRRFFIFPRGKFRHEDLPRRGAAFERLAAG